MTEPWCWSHETVAGLTDAQILYVRQTQAEKVRAASGAKPPPPSSRDGPVNVVGDEPPNRSAMLGVMVHMLGMSVERANAEYDAQLARWKAAKEAGTTPEW